MVLFFTDMTPEMGLRKMKKFLSAFLLIASLLPGKFPLPRA